jgi:chorismate mutase
MLHCYADEDRPVQHVYLREAATLRTDIQGAQ